MIANLVSNTTKKNRESHQEQWYSESMRTNLPCETDRSYYPTIADINNHIYKSKTALQLSKYDQHNLLLKIEEWKKVRTDSRHFFRPFKSQDCQEESLHPAQSLLWVHQEKWQMELLSRHGNEMSLIDATYKTTKYDLPLFFICVRTNVGYSIVAEFIVQSEDTDSILEAVNILKEWNPKWAPNFFLCDYSEAEIGALEQAFTGVVVYLCDFHREQAWTRWIRESKHGLSNNDSESLLSMLRACAWAPPGGEGEDRDCHYQQAVTNLQNSQIRNGNIQVQQWLDSTWLNCPQVQ